MLSWLSTNSFISTFSIGNITSINILPATLWSNGKLGVKVRPEIHLDAYALIAFRPLKSLKAIRASMSELKTFQI